MKTKSILAVLLVFASAALLAQPTWLTLGNGATVDGTHFLGTTNNVPLSFRVNNQKGGRIDHILYNAFFGHQAGNAITTGIGNTAIGETALYSLTSGAANTSAGFQTLYSCTTGTNNTGFGAGSLFLTSTGSYNTAVGGGAMTLNTTGAYNTALGDASLNFNTTGSYNTALGSGAGVSSGGLTNATAVGSNATVTASNAMQLGDGNVTQIFAGTGTTAKVITGGLQVTGGSPASGKVLTSDASGNATWQTASLPSNGWSTLGNAGTVDGTNFIGTTDAVSLSFRTYNYHAGKIDIFNANTSLGPHACEFVSTGWGNCGFGANALNSNTTGDANCAMGVLALGFNSGGSANVAIGQQALVSNDGGNSCVGYASGYYNTSGSQNSALGFFSFRQNITGNYNTALGAYAEMASSALSNATSVGHDAVVQGSNLIQLGDANVSQIECWSGVYTTTSDQRFKNNISEKDVKGLEFIKRLRPVVYNFDAKKMTEFATKNMPDSMRRHYLDKNFEAVSAIRQSGFLAQEVEKAAKEVGYDFNGVQIPKDENGHYSLAYSQFVVPLVKAVQEQQAMIEKLQKQLDAQNSNPSVITGIASGSDLSGFNMEQNVPNPFTHKTVISYSLPKSIGKASMNVYDLTGKQIASFDLSDRNATSITLSAEQLSAGIYIYSIIADGKIMDSKRMVVADK